MEDADKAIAKAAESQFKKRFGRKLHPPGMQKLSKPEPIVRKHKALMVRDEAQDAGLLNSLQIPNLPALNINKAKF